MDEIKLGIDQHAGSYRIVRMIDGTTPQPALSAEEQAELDRLLKDDA